MDAAIDMEGPTTEVTMSFEVALPRRKVWDVLADTQHINEIFYKTGRATLVNRGSEKARLRGTYGLFAPEYDEYPWEFEAPHRWGLRRVFTGGVLKVNAVSAVLTETAVGTQVEYANSIVTTRSPLGVIARAVFRFQVRRALARLETFIRAMPNDQAIQWPPANPYASIVFARAAPFAEELRRIAPRSHATIDVLLSHVANAGDFDVARMRPYELAEQWEQPRDVVLALFLRATRVGLLRLSWDILCPNCENPPTAVDKLEDLPAGQTHCPACDITFEASFDQSVEATFSPTSAVRDVEQGLFCYGSPRHTPNWVAQFVVDPGTVRSLQTELGEGRYRVQAAGVDMPTFVEVGAGGEDEVSVTVKGADAGPLFATEGSLAKPGSVKLTVQNDDVVARRIQLVHRRFASNAVLAPDVTALGIFRDLFTNDVLARDQSLQVGRSVILFTDLVGSTAMYERIGDAEAYAIVRKHFEVMDKAIAAHGGRVVKTIGDAVMASFPRVLDAIEAGWDGILGVHAMSEVDGAPAELALKVGVHVGPCLAVEANHTSDYFGRTVNVAARVQGIAGADEIVISDAAMQAQDVRAWVEKVRAEGADVRDDKQAIRGVAGQIEVVRVKLRDGPATLEFTALRSDEDSDPDATRDDRAPPKAQVEARAAPAPSDTLID